MTSLGIQIRTRRNEIGIGIKTLAKELEVDYSHLSRVENDKISPSKDLLLKIANTLQFDADIWMVSNGLLPDDVLMYAKSHPEDFLRFSRKFVSLDNDESQFQKKENSVISLFTGAGGLDLGLEIAGFETAACVEFNSDFRKTIRMNRPEWNPIEDFNGDVTKISSSYLLHRTGLKKGEVALVVGGAPCQPFSNLGMKKGTSDERGVLFKDFVRIIRDTYPKGFIFENVEGITQSKHSQVLEIMKRELSDLGYEVDAKILLAADYGVPQKRKRLFVIGCRSGIKPEFPSPTHAKNGEGGLLPWVTVQRAFSKIKDSDFLREDCKMMNHSSDMVKRIRLVPAGGNFHDLPRSRLPACWKTGLHQGSDTFGRLRLDQPSVTIRTCGYNPTKGRYIHPTEHRGLNTIEMAVLQSFPSDYRFHGGLKTIGEQIGNAVPPLLAAAIGKSMFKAIKEVEKKESSNQTSK